MGSYEEKKVLLELLRTKSQVDCDSLDISRKHWSTAVIEKNSLNVRSCERVRTIR